MCAGGRCWATVRSRPSTEGSSELGALGHRPFQDARHAKTLTQGIELVTESRVAFLAPPHSGHASPHPLAAGPEPCGQATGPWSGPQLRTGWHPVPSPVALPARHPDALHSFEARICVQTMNSDFKPV